MDAYLAHRRHTRSMTEDTIRSTEDTIRHFFNVTKKQTVRQIGEKEIEKFYMHHWESKQATINTYTARLTAFYSHLVRFHKIEENHFHKYTPHKIVPSQVAREAWIDKKEIRRLLNACKDPRLKFILYMGFHCGCRKKEVIMSRPTWFDMKQRKLNIPFGELLTFEPFKGKPERQYFFQPKNKRDRSIPLSREFYRFLRTQFHFEENQAWCLEPKSKGFGERYRYDFRRPLEEFFEEHGVGHLTTHGMRHSFASNCIMAGVSTFKVASWLGNRERTVETHYAHPRSTSEGLRRRFLEQPHSIFFLPKHSPQTSICSSSSFKITV